MATGDHCFIYRVGEVRGIAFCSAGEIDREAARALVGETLAAYTEDAGAREVVSPPQVRYVGALDFGDMDPEAKEMLDVFERHDPVWLVRVAPSEGGQ